MKKILEDVMLICVGNSKVKGDSLGPMLGSFFVNNNLYDAIVIGTTNNPLSYNKLEQMKNYIDSNKLKKKIIIDSALGNSMSIGKIYISEKSFIVGDGVNKGIKLDADFIIKGVVGTNHTCIEKNKKELQNVDEKILKSMMNKIIEILPILV